ncbi:hypothetical protein [Methanosarcina barkeri]|uniref:Uncharacterized protein n=1 Tax=Methanosarcina barkeri (strain Fusaro / DSM 804) TaxID=269797 RepID=Q467N0_METBF|nr:hypothetical protein [Methanosarcina barkeri]
MIVKTLELISRFTMVLIILSAIPSGAFASDNATLTDSMYLIYDPGSCPSDDISEENFTEVQADMLDSISKRITELQTLYSEISEVSTASYLQKALSRKRQKNEGIENDGRNMEPDEMPTEPDEVHGFCHILLENITDENFAEVQDVILDSLQNMTEKAEAAQTRLTEAGESSKAEELNEKITEIRDMYTKVSEASTAAELKEVLLTHEQAKALDSVEENIGLLKARINESGNASDKQLNSRITELTALIEDIEGAKSFDELKKIMHSARDTAM